MKAHEPDRFELVRRDLLAATQRHAARARRRQRIATTAASAALGLTLLTGIAAATSERVGKTVRAVRGSVTDVLLGEPETGPGPDKNTVEALHDMAGLNARPNLGEPRVLLRKTIDGVDVEIVAMERHVTGRASHDASDKPELCYSVAAHDPRADLARSPGGIVCTPEFNPGMPINIAASYEGSCDGGNVTLSGVASRSVMAVRFQFPDDIERATMAGGAFWWRGATTPDRVLIDLVDGSTVQRPYPYEAFPSGEIPLASTPAQCEGAQ